MNAGNWCWDTDGLQPGDLVFWSEERAGDGWDWTETYHVGIYTGDGMCVSANGVNMGVCEHEVWIDSGFVGGGWPLSDCDGWDEPKWVKDGDRWWYRHADGSYTRDDWERIDDKWYHFDGDGWMQTGWFKDSDSRWYYLSEARDYTEGSMVESDVRAIGGKWYAFGPSGEMLYHVDADESGALRLTDTRSDNDA
jgi:glucan-binding YG repeat protein